MLRSIRPRLFRAVAGLWLFSSLAMAQQDLIYLEKGRFEPVDLVGGSLEIVLLDLDLANGVIEFDLLNQSTEPITAWQIRLITIFEDDRRIWEDVLGDYIQSANRARPDPLPKYHSTASPLWPQQSRHHRRTLGRNPDAAIAKVQVIARGVAFRDSEMLGVPSATAYIRDRRIGELKALNSWISRIDGVAGNSGFDSVLALKQQVDSTKSDYGAINNAQKAGVAAALSSITADLKELVSKGPSQAEYGLTSLWSSLKRAQQALRDGLRLKQR